MAKIVLRDLDLPFEGSKIKNVVCLKREELTKKCVSDINNLQILPFAIEWRQCENCTMRH